MKNGWIYCACGVLLMFWVVGCAHRDTGTVAPPPHRDYQIIQYVLIEGESKVFSMMTILEDGRYQWQMRDWWAVPVIDHSFSGQLPVAILRQLQREKHSWEIITGVRVYQWSQSTPSESVPQGIRQVAEYLRETHFP